MVSGSLLNWPIYMHIKYTFAFIGNCKFYVYILVILHEEYMHSRHKTKHHGFVRSKIFISTFSYELDCKQKASERSGRLALTEF